MVLSKQNKNKGISFKQAEKLVKKFFALNDYTSKRLLLIVPDNTRSGPVGRIFQMIYECISEKAAAIDILVALGTHQPLNEEQICRRLEITKSQRKKKYAKVRFFNHQWNRAEVFKTIGTIKAGQIGKLTEGLFREEVKVAINRKIFEYDEFFIIGPVFPHEVVGFSGGFKYIFPGISGPEIINFYHWLGAVITNPVINGVKRTPTRAVIEKAASFINLPSKLFALVACANELKGLFIGDVSQSWEQAADLSSKVHIVYQNKPFNTVIGISPEMYEDLWTAGKVMYKLESIVADGGRLIIYAPHIKEVCYTHGKILKKIGYHTRDYFLKQWEKFKDYPRGLLAHSTHIKGAGSFDGGVEKPRINVFLATGISRQLCKKINLEYMNPAEINIKSFKNKEKDGILLVDHAGETLYKLKKDTRPKK
jgi:lactate racemase